MKLLFLAVLAALALSTAVASATDPPSRLRVLQFNVLNGATGDRTAAVIAVIKAANADVVTLDEVNDQATFDRIAAATGLHALYARAADGYSVGVLSRYPLRRCSRYQSAPIRHSAYGCRVDLPSGAHWWVFGAHLYPFDEKVRAQEIAYLIAKMRPHLPAPTVLTGDLNTDTPGETNGMGTEVVPLLRAAGFRDSYRDLHAWPQDRGFTAPTPAYGEWEQRVDYVFHSRAARTTSARVVYSVPGYTWPSDHAAVLVGLTTKR